MALGSELLTANPSLGDRVTMERLPHRLDRLVQWMEENSLDATVAFGAVNAAHLGSYARYYGGPAGIVVGRDRSRTLVVMYDEVPVAQELGDADVVLPYGERGFGLNLNPLPLLADVVAGVGTVKSAKRIGFSDELGGMADLLRSGSDAEQVDAGPTLHRIRMLKDEDELVKVLHSYELAWMAQAKVGELAQQPGVTEIELFSAALSTAQNANGAPIEWLCDMLSGPLTSKVCCPIHVASPRAVEDGDPVVTDIALGAHGYFGDTAETHICGSNPEVAAVVNSGTYAGVVVAGHEPGAADIVASVGDVAVPPVRAEPARRAEDDRHRRRRFPVNPGCRGRHDRGEGARLLWRSGGRGRRHVLRELPRLPR